ncbi:hypothetical protein CPB84DRAFT_1790121, partial [Gymnopilus junonius]
MKFQILSFVVSLALFSQVFATPTPQTTDPLACGGPDNIPCVLLDIDAALDLLVHSNNVWESASPGCVACALH